jgi:hypothetical protein
MRAIQLNQGVHGIGGEPQEATYAPCQGLGKPGQLRAGRGPHPGEAQRAVGELDVHSVQDQHMEVDRAAFGLRLSALPKR